MDRPTNKTRIVVFVVRVQLLEEAMGPIYIVTIGARPNELKIYTVARNPRRKTTELRRVVLGPKVAAASPTLVANAPVTYPKWLRQACSTAQVRQRCTSRRRIAVFHPT